MSGIVSKNAGRGSGIVGAGDIGADAVDNANIADNAIDSEHYTDGSIDNAHIADNAIDSEHYADGSIDNAHIADDAIDSEHYADGSIDNAHIADDAIDSEHYAAGSIDEAHIADNAVTLAKMAGGTDGNIISYDASGNPVAIATGSDGQVLTSTGAGSPPAFEAAAGGGKVLQAVYTNFTTQSSISADDYDLRSGTAPTSSEGNELTTLAITPVSASSKLYYHADFNIGDGADSKHCAIMLFRDSVSTCLNLAQLRMKSGGEYYSVSFSGVLDSDATSETTLKIRVCGAASGQTLYINRGSNTTTFGGSTISSGFRILEIDPS